ncbi:hypothetical protein IGI04_007987, partial [Brassica rapa subsp. trilocularis]
MVLLIYYFIHINCYSSNVLISSCSFRLKNKSFVGLGRIGYPVLIRQIHNFIILISENTRNGFAFLSKTIVPYLLFLLLCLLNVITIISKKSLKGEAVLFGGNFPALYVIGDSLVDPGNNNHLLTLVRANFKPYGSNFEGGKATGRFSDGKTIADYIAIYYGLPLAPAYMGLSKKEKKQSLNGCGIFPDTGKQFGRCLSMNVQIDLLNKTIEKNLKKKFKTQSELSRHLGGSLFRTAIGVNDYAFTYKKNATDANEFASKLLNEFLIHLERLYNLGAQNFFVNNIKPLGCYPNIIAET